MRLLPVVAATALASPALAAPWKLSSNPTELATQTFDAAQSWIHGALHSTEDKLKAYETLIGGGITAGSVVVGGKEFLSLEHPAFPEHRLRVVEPKICDSDVHQLSGYLDISEKKHLFFWFQASRRNPKKDPLVLWLNGGPGCSSTTGLLFELGGCRVANEGHNTTYNKFAWNSVANVIYLDQPTGVGFSYSDEGDVNNSPAAAEDVYAFLALFISKFTQYSKQDFHVAGESYAGTYIPNIANVIHNNNKALSLSPIPGIPKLNFRSIMIGNGLTDPYHQFPSLYDAACEGDYALWKPDAPQCISLKGKVPRCQNLIASCYRTKSRFSCVPAALYCWQLFNDVQQTGLNIYDVRRTCNKDKDKDGPLCYKEMGWIETFINDPKTKQELGAPMDRNFESCNMQINQNFLLQGDGVHDTASLLPPLVEDGLRVLIYSGQADMIVNYVGCAQVLDNLETSYLQSYTSAKVKNFTDTEGDIVGYTKSAGKGAGNVAYVALHNAGHMVPHDDPKGALAMFSRWLDNKSLAA